MAGVTQNEDFAEVAIDAFMVSQGGAAALVLVWVWWNYVVVAFMRMLCCRKYVGHDQPDPLVVCRGASQLVDWCSRRVSKKKKKARAAVQAVRVLPVTAMVGYLANSLLVFPRFLGLQAKAAKKQTKQKNAKQSQKKAQAAAESSDDSDVDEPSNAELAALVARKKLKKRRR